MADSKIAQKYWWIKNKTIGIGWLDRNVTTNNYALTAVTNVEEVVVHFKVKLDKISALDTTLSNKLPTQFDDALVSRAIEKGYEVNPNPDLVQLAVYWGQKFESQLKRIQEYSNKETSKTPKIIKTNYPYAIK